MAAERYSSAARARTALVYPLYDLRRGTAKFWSDDSCVGCGVCARRCPVQAIRLVDGRPEWVAPRCDHCMEICKTQAPPTYENGTHKIHCHLFKTE